MPPISTTETLTLYNDLVTLLHSTPPRLLEIDILPSTFPPEIHFSAADSALGIPKVVLITCFLHARTLLLNSVRPRSRPSSLLSPPPPRRQATKESSNNNNGDDDDNDNGNGDEEAILQATSVILLWEPNHYTAINWRKGHVLPRAASSEAILEAELVFSESLLTSPLPKHVKAPTLWAHRLWLFRTFKCAWRCSEQDRPGSTGQDEKGGKVVSLSSSWLRELEVVVKAGERHPRNYHAWEYARRLFSLIGGVVGDPIEGDGEKAEAAMARKSVEKVRKWCFLHPRDISAWTFLSWLLERVFGGDEKRDGCGREIVDTVSFQTKEFVRNYRWTGESIEWFLTNTARLTTENIGADKKILRDCDRH